MENNEKTKIKGSYNFSNINYDILKKIIDIDLIVDFSVFDEWFNYPYSPDKTEIMLLEKLINAHNGYLHLYSEHQLQAQFINPLLSIVNFNTKKFRAWYEYEISGIINNYELKGRPDFMIATGKIKPEKPYFFFQEFKKSKTNSNPDFQLLAEMSVAMEINKTNIIRGIYNIGQHWYFVILKKIKEGKYQYYESESFNCLKIHELKQIYINLQAVKHKYCGQNL